MSMSQEEIEALMSGVDDTEVDEVKEENAIESETTVLEEEPIEELNVDDILAGIDGIVDDEPVEEAVVTEEELNVDDILAGIDGIVDDEPAEEAIVSEDISATVENKDEKNEISEIETKINNNEYPLPVSNENKVVNQLNQVADDSEQKVSQIFDVLSFILDENDEISKYNKNMSDFIQKQATLLESLSIKFPNVTVFSENLEDSKKLLEESKDLSSKLDAENNKVFEAMELMQFNDINRQKIERVMAVIKKLSGYLNGIFEDDSGRDEVQIAKHIPGDASETVNEEDLDSLISEFSK